MNIAIKNNITRTLRLLIGGIGGYFFSNGFMAIIGLSLPHLGMAQSESLILAIVIGLFIYISIILWVIATRHLAVVTSLIAAFSSLVFFTAPNWV